MSDGKPILSDGDVRLLGLAWQCLKDGKPINQNLNQDQNQIDFEKLTSIAGYTNIGSTRNRINAIMKKLKESGGGDSEGPSSPATPASKTDKASAATTGTKRKKGLDTVPEDDHEDFVKKEDNGDNGISATASPPKAKRGRKPAPGNANNDINIAADAATAASLPPGPTARGRPKKAKTNEAAGGTAATDISAGGGRTRTTRSRSASTGFTAQNGSRGRVVARAENAGNATPNTEGIKEEGEYSA